MRTGVFGGTFNPVHNGHIRLAQTYIAALRLDRLLVIPTHLPPHKTADTLERLNCMYPADELYLIMGSDMFVTLTEWYRWKRIFELAVICVGAREPNLRPELERYRKHLEALGAQCRIVDLEPVLVSSTEVRDRVCEGREIRSLVPDAVAAYIEQNKLYL